MIETLQIAALGGTPLKSSHYYADKSSMIVDTLGGTSDREFMFVESEPHTNIRYHKDEVALPGQFLSQREDPRMAQIHALPRLYSLRLAAEGHDTVVIPEESDVEANFRQVSVWGWNGIGVDQGDEAAEWGREVIGRPVRLVKTSLARPRYVEGNRDLGIVGFSDGYPLLVTSTASINAVNDQLGKAGKDPVDSARFRPNIVLGGEEGLEPFIEDRIEVIEFDSEGLIWRFLRAKACSRCVIVDRDPDTGNTKPGVQKALTTLGRAGVHADIRFGDGQKLFFGQNFVIQTPEEARYDQPARIAKGAEVRVRLNDEPNWKQIS